MQIRLNLVLLAAALVCAVPARMAAGFSEQAAPRIKTSTKAPPASGDRADINHASADELMKVPGMTSTWAARIVRFRPYRSKQDLLDRGVVTSEVYDRIKDYVIAHRDK